jgi:nicotinamidase-related amidase
LEALIIVDAQNEFSPQGCRPVPNHAHALETIQRRVAEARSEGRPIAWVRHHNRPDELPAFAPGSWGAAYSPGLGPLPGRDEEAEFVKDVFGAFTGTDVGAWLAAQGVREVLIVGFFVHMCVSTTAREALMRGLHVAIDPAGTGGFPIRHELLGEQSAVEVHRTALLQLSHLGVRIAASKGQQSWSAE